MDESHDDRASAAQTSSGIEEHHDVVSASPDVGLGGPGGAERDALRRGSGEGSVQAGQLSEEELAVLDAFHKSSLTPARWSAFDSAHPSATAPLDLDVIPDDLRRTCIVEAAEDVAALRAQVQRLQDRTDDPAPVAEMGRIAHKIRGTASTFGLDMLAELMLAFEEVLRFLRSRRGEARLRDTPALVGLLDLMEHALRSASADEAPDPQLALEAARLRDRALEQAGISPAAPAGAPSAGRVSAGEVSAESDTHPGLPIAMQLEGALRVDPRRLDRLLADASTLPLGRALLLQTRDELARLQSEMDQSLARLGQLGRRLSDLQPTSDMPTLYALGNPPKGLGSWTTSALSLSTAAHRRADPDTETLHDHPHAHPTDFEPEHVTELDHLSRALTEAIEDVTSTGRTIGTNLGVLAQSVNEQAEVARTIQHDVVHLRLVPLAGVMQRLQLEVSRLAHTLGKSVTFSARGEMIELDRAISVEVTEPLVQLARNAVVHGIETPEERLKVGKSATGKLWFHASYVGTDVIIEVGDDGRGASPQALVEAAVKAGVLDAQSALALAPAEALDLMFIPGLSTFETPQMVSGHGVGLDEVRTTIERLKGSVQVRSEVGAGTVFRIRVPMSLSVVKALHIRAGGHDYAVPFSSVQRTLSLSPAELLVSSVAAPGEGPCASDPVSLHIRIEPAALSSPLIQPMPAEHRLEEIPAFPLAELLGFAHERHDPQLALVVNRGSRRVALLVDEILDDHEAVVQTLPPHLRRRVVRGATVTSEGRLLLVLDLHEVVAGVLDGAPLPTLRRPQISRPATRPAPPRVLVVDDSVSIRHALETALTRAGFAVQLARDGVEALELMLASPPRVLVLDIEMPRLDGFELLSIMRASPQFDGVRVVMLTSRTGAALREHALQLGAAAYLTKPCPEETLIETVRAQLAPTGPST